MRAPGEVSRLGAAFSYSVLFMLSMPVLIIAGFAAACYCAVRKHQRQLAAQSAERHAPSVERQAPSGPR
jgi:hypothetical protein